tara:strand:- start:5595 stop:10961 length:5367 start_codon:yes stop_codon:yes gene_type:complete
MAETTSISNISSNNLQTQDYSVQDINLLNEYEINREFGAEQDIVEHHIYSATNNILYSNYNFADYSTLLTNPENSLFDTLYIDPKQDLTQAGYNIGNYNVIYQFYRPLLLSSNTTRYFIKEISSDRTEIKITTNDLSFDAVGTSYFNYIASQQGKSFYSDLILNFGNNQTLIGVNTLLDTANELEPSIFVKLYEPLPSNYNLKDTLWIVEEVSDPISFNINVSFIADETEEVEYLRGPNTNIDLNKKTNFTTKYFNISEILSTTLTSSYQQVKSVLEEKSININIDHTEYGSFVHFSSAYERLENFKYKLNLVQNYQTDLNQLTALDPLTDQTSISASKATLQENIDKLIEQFDNYEYYLYFESGSKAWPKTNTTLPYNNYAVTSDTASVWFGSEDENSDFFGGQILSASLYDIENRNYIWNTLPSYVQEDVQNQGLELLVSMLGQHFDSIWTYTRAISDLRDADNRPEHGISKDLVADALRSLGIKLYTTNRTGENIFSSLTGLGPSGSLVPETGSYRIENYVSASNEPILYDDLNKEVYKRIYHNLPYLLKTRGTINGVRALLNCFGIADDILRINEYGGNTKNKRQITQYHEKSNYILDTRRTSSVEVPWLPTLMPMVPDHWEEVEQDWNNIEGWWNGTIAEDQVPDSVEFRFKTKGIPSSSYYTQSLFQVNNSNSRSQFGIQLLYPSASNAALGGDTYNTYGELRFILSGSQGYTSTDPLYFPFFSGSFWNVKLDRSPAGQNLNDTGSNITYELIAKSGQYDGNNNYIDFEGSASLVISGSTSSSYNEAWNSYLFTTGNHQLHGYLGGASSSNIIAPDGITFDGYFQEFRYWITNLSQSTYDQHVLNPTSYVDNDITSSYYNLIYRLPLGNYDFVSGSNGDNAVYTVHPMSTGSFAPTASFLGTGSSTVNYGIITNFSTSSFVTHSNVDLMQGPDIGAFTANDQKIRTVTYPYASGSTLSPYISVQEKSIDDTTADLDIAEVGISIQNSIDNDIINQLGFFDIDEYVGDPKLAASSSYPDLNELRDFYFKKYYKKSNYTDIVKLLSYYDSSLFKMLKDFVPAKTLLNTGLIIKPHILERNKTEKFEPSFTYVDHSGSSNVVSITGSTPMGIPLDTTYTGNITIPSSSANTITASGVVYNFTDNREPFTGEYSGSELTVYTQPTTSVVTELNFFNAETEYSTSISYSATPLDPTFNNISEARKSVQYMDLDYSTNIITPVNIGFITSRSFGEITEEDSPFLDASIQDSNYTLLRNINPRYLGSKTISQKYNDYVVGDSSYGQTAAIDLNSLKFAYFSEVVETGSFFPDRCNVYVKYLIDGRANITELTRKNETIFDLQNIFNANKEANISLDDNQLLSDQKYLDGLKPVYAGGFRFLPSLQNPTGSATLVYNFTSGSITNITKEDLRQVPTSLGGQFIEIGNFDLGTIEISSGSNVVNVGGYPSIKLTRNAPVNQSTIWWDNDLLINIEGQVELEVNIPKNPSASFEYVTWNPFNGSQPILSSSIDLGEFALLKATYHVTNSVILPKNTNEISAILEDSPSSMGGRFETDFSTPEIISASINIGQESVDHSEPKYTYYFPSDPVIALTSSITDGGDAGNGNALFVRNTTGSFNILTASVSMSYWYENFIQTSSVYESGSDSFGIVDEEFSIQEGDLFRFVDVKAGEAGTGSGIFPREFERQVKRVNVIPRDEVTNTNRLTIEFDKDIPARACEDFPGATLPEDAKRIKRFIILKKVQDETNIVLDFEKQSGRTSSGIVLPADIPKALQERAGNIVKELKSQNLIS